MIRLRILDGRLLGYQVGPISSHESYKSEELPQVCSERERAMTTEEGSEKCKLRTLKMMKGGQEQRSRGSLLHLKKARE